jgi:hypothetical protein
MVMTCSRVARFYPKQEVTMAVQVVRPELDVQRVCVFRVHDPPRALDESTIALTLLFTLRRAFWAEWLELTNSRSRHILA